MRKELAVKPGEARRRGLRGAAVRSMWRRRVERRVEKNFSSA